MRVKFIKSVIYLLFFLAILFPGQIFASSHISEDGDPLEVPGSIYIITLGTITTGQWNATVIVVSYGGTGAATFTNYGVLLGSGTDPITATDAFTDGQLLIGSTGADPVPATLTAGDALTATTGAGTLELDVDGAGVVTLLEALVGAAQLSHDDGLSDVSADDHHAQTHTIVSHDTTATGANLTTLTDDSMADILHRHSELSASDGTPDRAIALDASGNVRIGTPASNYTAISDTGVLTLAGTARVTDSFQIDITVPRRPVANPPGEGVEDGFPTLDYDDSAEESIFLEFHLPHGYADAGMVDLHFDFFVDTAPGSAANAGWGIEYKKVSHGDIFTFTGTTTLEAATAIITGTPANDKKIHESTGLSFTTAGWTSDDTIYIRLYRNVGVANDFTGDVRMIGKLHLEYLRDRLGD